MLGSTVGSYTITDLLGEGGMGAVWAGEHTQLKRKAAIKVLRDELSHDREVVARFFNEAKAATAVDHPGIVDVFDFGYDAQGRAYIVMEYIEGETLAARRRRFGRLPVGEALTLCRQVAGALGAAHARGIVHRDLKPDNIMLVRDPKLLDPAAREGDEPAVSTKTGRILGTPAYMAPEQCRGAGAVDHRADMYALGCVLYALVCGRPPFEAVGSGDLIAAHLLKEPPAPRTLAAGIPAPVEEVILRLLAKLPEDRYDSMADVVAALEGASAGALPAGLGVRRSAVMAAERQRMAAAATVDDVVASPPDPALAATAAPVADDLAVRTTLGAAAHQSAATSPSPAPRAWRRAALAIGGLAAIAVIAVVWGARSTPTTPGALAPAATQAAARSPEPPPAPPPVPASTTVSVTITSEPAGATVVGADGAAVGETPFTRSFPRGEGDRRFVIRRRGYQDEPVALIAGRDGARHVVLRAIERRRRTPVADTAPPTAAASDASAAAAPARRPPRPIKDGALDPYAP